MKLSDIIKKYEEGVTFKHDGKDYKPMQFKHGFAVSITNNVLDAVTLDDITKIDNTASYLNLKKYYFGYWHDKKTSKNYLDLTLKVDLRSEAVSIARAFNQLAIFNFATLQTEYIERG